MTKAEAGSRSIIDHTTDMEESDDADLDRQALVSSLDQTGFLLQRLHELRLWQKEQEQRLVRQHDLQREQLEQDGKDLKKEVTFLNETR
jgi:hypothetical protein